MKSNLMNLSELAELLAYTDMRSVTSWCNKNNILVAHVGKAKYVAADQISKFFENKFKRFAEKKFDNPDQIINAHNSDDKVGLSESMGIRVSKKIKKSYTAKKERSKAAQDFLNNIKSA